jgi:alpha-methylacyl-CoA racemase
VGPLAGHRIIELAGIGPGPHCAMLLADLGAEIVRVARTEPDPPALTLRRDLTTRGRRSLRMNLKHPDAVAALLRMLEHADALIEGFRPGVMERLGLGPEVCLERNPRLVYGRVTGFGQDGPLAAAAGHDINYIALAGVLAHVGRPGQPPTVPLNLIGDYAGGGLLLAFGVVSALLERVQSGAGQVVDASMVDGAASLMTFLHGIEQEGGWSEARGSNLFDGGAPFYDVYETADEKFISVGALEPRFFAQLLECVGLDAATLPEQFDRRGWPEIREQLARIFRGRTRDAWCEILEGTDACFAPVLSMAEAREHPHNRARGTFVALDGALHPAPAPRFSRTPGQIRRPSDAAGAHTDALLAEWGLSAEQIAALRAAGAVA